MVYCDWLYIVSSQGFPSILTMWIEFSMSIVFNNVLWKHLFGTKRGTLHIFKWLIFENDKCKKLFYYSWWHFAYLCASQATQVEYLSVSNCDYSISGDNPVFFKTVYWEQATPIVLWIVFPLTQEFMSHLSYCSFSNNQETLLVEKTSLLHQKQQPELKCEWIYWLQWFASNGLLYTRNEYKYTFFPLRQKPWSFAFFNLAFWSIGNS